MESPKISIIFVTKRGVPALDILAENLERQTFQDFEVIVADEGFDFTPERYEKHFKPRRPEPDDAWNLNKAYNDCLEFAEGELLVFLQDFIWIPDDGLARFWEDYQAHPNALISGVGHKALHGLEGISEPDMRISEAQGISPCPFTDWELNWSCAPWAIMPKFNEAMDKWYGGENQYVAKKAVLQGAEILIDHSNACMGYSQEECAGRPKNWEERHSNKDGRLASFLDALSPA